MFPLRGRNAKPLYYSSATLPLLILVPSRRFIFRSDTALHRAAWYNCLDIAQTIIQAGGDINTQNDVSAAPMFHDSMPVAPMHGTSMHDSSPRPAAVLLARPFPLYRLSLPVSLSVCVFVSLCLSGCLCLSFRPLDLAAASM